MKIISLETIKPSSPTPSHLRRTHVLSLADSVIPRQILKFVFFYNTYNDTNINILKQSLSQCLTHYYPLAGRFLDPPASVIDCNDKGVEFVEASHDNHLDDFIEISKIHDIIPNVSSTNLLHVQLNHFQGRGVALVISLSHTLTDGFAASTFISQWAKIARGEPSFKPNFFTSTTRYNNAKQFTNEETQRVKHVRRSFVFPNSNISKLKNKIISMGLDQTYQTNSNPTRVEVLTSLLFKCMVDSATVNSRVFRPSVLVYPINMRKKIFKTDPERAAGNILSIVVERIDDSNKMELNEIVCKVMKGKTIEEKDVLGIGENLDKAFKKIGGDATARIYPCSSFCWFPLYDVDFGWGKPVNVKYVGPDAGGSYFNLLDTPNKDGVEAIVHLPEEEMVIFQRNKELLSYVGV